MRRETYPYLGSVHGALAAAAIMGSFSLYTCIYMTSHHTQRILFTVQLDMCNVELASLYARNAGHNGAIKRDIMANDATLFMCIYN